MSEISSSNWSETAASNNAAAPNGWSEGMAPAAVNDTARESHAAIKKFWKRINPSYNSTGSANAYVLTPDVALAAYVDGEIYSFQANFANTASATLNISSLGAKTIKKPSNGSLAALVADDIVSGQPVQCCYDGTDMILVSPPGKPLFALESIIIAASDETTALTTGTAKVTFRMPYAFTLTDVRASVTTAPTGSVLTIDINESGTTILSTKLTIDASEKTSTTAATAAVISDTALADDAQITIDIDGVGSTVAGAGLKVTLIGRQT